MKRIFVAIPVSDSIRRELYNVQQSLPVFAGLRKTPQENFHITLFFIGEVEEVSIPEIIRLLSGYFRNVAPFTLNFSDFSYAGNPHRPSMIWTRFEKSEIFSTLHSGCKEICTSYMTIHPIERDPVPHITLARLRNRNRKDEMIELPNTTIQLPRVSFSELWQTEHTAKDVWYRRLAIFLFKPD